VLSSPVSIVDYLPNSQNERRITPEDYVRLYNEEWAWIRQFRGAADTIVLTHFPPNAACTAPQFAESPLNPYFINDVDLTGFAYWFAVYLDIAECKHHRIFAIVEMRIVHYGNINVYAVSHNNVEIYDVGSVF